MATADWLKKQEEDNTTLTITKGHRKKANASEEENLVLKHDPNDKHINLLPGSQD